MADQVDNLILKTESSEENLKRLTRELAKTEDSISALQSTFQAGAISFGDFDKRLDALSVRAQALRGAMASVDSGTAHTSESTRSLTQAFQTLSYTTNDATQFFVSARAGVNAIANNIPAVVNALTSLAQVGFGGVLTALTGPAGLILGLTAAAALVPVLSAHWSDLEDAFGLGGTRTEADEMERLARATEKSAEETRKLNEYKERQRVGGALESARPAEEKKTEEAAIKAIGEFGRLGTSGNEALIQGLVNARNPGGVPLMQEGKDRLAAIEETGTSFRGPEVAAQELETARREELAKAQKAAVEQARKDVEASIAGQRPGGIGGLIKEIETTPGAFPEGFAQKLREATPEGRRARELNVQGEEFAEASRKEAEEQRKQVQAEEAELTDEDQKASDKRLAKLKQQRDDRVKALASGGLGTQLLQGKAVSAADVQKELGRAGVENVGDDLAGKYRKALAKSIDEQVDARALKEGVSTDTAREHLIGDREEASRKQRSEGVDRSKQEFQRRLKSAEEDDPGLQDLLRVASRVGFARGGFGGAQSAVLQQLRARGLADTFGANYFAKEQAGDAFREALHAPQRSSEVLGAEDLNRSIQQAVGGAGDYQQKSYNELRQMNEFFRQQAQKQDTGGGFGFL